MIISILFIIILKSVEKVLKQNHLWNRREDKIFSQQEKISGRIKDLNVDFKEQLEEQNETQSDLLHWIVAKITKKMDTNMHNVSHHLRQAKIDREYFRSSLNVTKVEMNDLNNLTQMGLDLQRNINHQGQSTLDEIGRLKSSVYTLMYNSSAVHDGIIKSLLSNRHLYDAKTKQIKLSISVIEYKILNWLTTHLSEEKGNNGEVDGQDALTVEELKFLEKGTY